MMLRINVNVTDRVDATLDALISALSGSKRTEINEVAAEAAVVAAKQYHKEFDERGGWRGPRTFGTGKSDFGSLIWANWFFGSADPDGATITNKAPHLRHKVTGGTITPKRAKYLTIPLTKESHGKTAKNYQRDNRKRLFTIPGRNALFEKVGEGGSNGESVTTKTRGRYRSGRNAPLKAKQEIRAVYALVKSVTQDPWPGALPPDNQLADAFAAGWLEALDDYLAKA